MEVRNPNMPLGEIISPDGTHYQGDHSGVFKVPGDFGNWLCGTPGWTPKDGASLGSISTKPSPEAVVAAAVGRPDGMSAEAHAKQLAREAAANAEPEVVRADTQEPQALGTAPPAPPAPPAPTLKPTTLTAPTAAPEEVAPETPEVIPEDPPVASEEAPAAPEAAQEGPNLEAMTKPELIATAAKFRERGYEIPPVTQTMLKGEIKTTISKVLYGE